MGNKQLFSLRVKLGHLYYQNPTKIYEIFAFEEPKSKNKFMNFNLHRIFKKDNLFTILNYSLLPIFLFLFFIFVFLSLVN